MSTSIVLTGGLLAIGLVWTALVAYTLVDRLLYDRQMLRLEAAGLRRAGPVDTDEAGNDVLDQALGRMGAGLLFRLVVDQAQAETLRRRVAALLLARFGVSALARDAAHGRWFSRRWRRIVAWHVLHQTRCAELHPLLRDALNRNDRSLAVAAAAMLGTIRDRTAAAILVEGLRQASCAPAFIAMQLDRCDTAIKEEVLSPLLDAAQPVLRLWAIRLLSRDPDIDSAGLRLGAHASDPDPGVRKAVAQAAGAVGGMRAAAVALRLLGDDAGFVRAHAVKALAAISGPDGEATLESVLRPLMSDSDWWVRMAVREALAGKADARIPCGPRTAGVRARVPHGADGGIPQRGVADVAHIPK